MTRAPHFFPPPDDTKIWRYLELPALVHLLSTKLLHFTRPDKFTDRFEGSASKVDWRTWGDQHAIPEILPEFKKAQWREGRRGVAINCWHMSTYESMAMWQLYGRSIAIESTFGQLMKSLAPPRNVVASVVKYIEHENDVDYTPNAIVRFFRKRKAFEHEHELRLIVSKMGDDFVGPGGKIIPGDVAAIGGDDGAFSVRRGGVPEAGIDLPIDPVVLIQNLVVAPECPDWVRESVATVVAGLGYSTPVKKSSLDADPLH